MPSSSPEYVPPPKRESALFYPKLLTTLRSYTLPAFFSDLSAGLIVGIVALPLAIAFAIASGVTPDRGLTTAIIAGFLISVLGGSRVQIGGPTGAFVVIVYGIVQKYGIDGLILCTLMAGAMLVLMGLFRLGTIIKFIPYPLTVGFTAGIAVVIFSSQVKDFLGLQIETLPADFIEKWSLYLQHFGSLQVPTLLTSLGALAILLLWPRLPFNFCRKVPGSIVAILALTLIVQALHLPVETIGSRFGSLPSGLPSPTWPHFDFTALKQLIGPAFTVALLGAIESLLSATVADGMIESKHRSNTELIAQGIANLVAPLFGGIPATGAIARTATNVKNGGRTPIAGIIHSFTLLLIVVLFGKWAKLIPLSALAAILVVVSYHMSEWRAFKTLLRAPKMDVAVLLTTFLLTVFVDLTVAVEIGMLMSMVLFMKRMTDVTSIKNVTYELAHEQDDESSAPLPSLPPGVMVYEAEGAFFFGVAETLRENLDIGHKPPKVMILKMKHVLALDATGIRALNDLLKACRRVGTALLLQGIHAQPFFALDRAGLLPAFGKGNVLESLQESLERAREILQNPASNEGAPDYADSHP